MAKGGSPGRENEDDAMLSKKPLGGMSCASCERNLINLSGQMVDYHAWKKLPFREPNERIARVIIVNLILLVRLRLLQDSFDDEA